MKYKPDPPSFRYTPSFNTDLRKTFARIREQQRDEALRVVSSRRAAPVLASSIVTRTARVTATEKREQ